MRNSCRSVVGQPRFYFDRNTTVESVSVAVDIAENIAGIGNIFGGDFKYCLISFCSLRGEFGNLGLISLALGESAGKNGWIRSYPETDRFVIRFRRFPETIRERERSSSQILTPLAESCARGLFNYLLSFRSSWAALTTASGVIPNSR